MPRCATLLAALAFAICSSFAYAPPARASDGYEVAIPLSGALIGVTALDVTFIVATSVGLTDRDDGWAALQLTYGLAGMIGCGVGMGYAFDNDLDGLGGALALQAIGSTLFAVYGALGLESEATPDIDLALAPTDGGFYLSARGTF